MVFWQCMWLAEYEGLLGEMVVHFWLKEVSDGLMGLEDA